jgi:hypothetical protein
LLGASFALFAIVWSPDASIQIRLEVVARFGHFDLSGRSMVALIGFPPVIAALRQLTTQLSGSSYLAHLFDSLLLRRRSPRNRKIRLTLLHLLSVRTGSGPKAALPDLPRMQHTPP